MELDSSFVLGKPIVVPLVRAVVVQNDVNLSVRRQFGDDRIQEPAEVLTLLLLGSLAWTYPLAISRAANRFNVPLRL